MRAKEIDCFLFEDVTLDDFKYMKSTQKTSFKALEFNFDTNKSISENYNNYIKTTQNPVSLRTFYNRFGDANTKKIREAITIEWIKNNFDTNKSKAYNYRQYKAFMSDIKPINYKHFSSMLNSI